MAQVIVELTGDERKVLESYRKAEEADRKLRESTGKTGEAGKTASKEFTDAWVKAGSGAIAGVDKLIAELKRIGPEGAIAATAVDDHFREVGKNGKQSMQQIIDKIGALDEEAGKAAALAAEKIKAELAEADKSAEFQLTLDSLRKLGPEGAETAKAIKADMDAAAVAARGSFDSVIAKVVQMRPEAAETAARVKMEFASAAKEADFKATLDALKRLGPEGDKIATAIAKDIDRAAAMSAGSIDQIITKIRGIDPAAAEAADRIKLELAAADAQTNFDKSIAELTKINPAAAQAAEKVRTELELADAGVKFDNIIAELRKVDPEAADQAAKLRGHMKTAADDGSSSWKSFATSTIAQIGAVAGAYIGIQEGIQVVNQYLKDQEKLSQDALSAQLELAKAQQEAYKNLLGFQAVERDELLQAAVPRIARDSSVSSAVVTAAISEAASAGITDSKIVEAAVTTSARLNRLTPELVAPNAAGIGSVMNLTSIKDPREAASLLTTAGPLSNVADPSDIAATLPKALATAATVPRQNPLEASRELAAMYGVASVMSVDQTGKSTGTFLIDFVTRMDALFSNLEDKQIDARSKVELIDRKIGKGLDTEANRRDRMELLQFLKETEGMKDPGTIFGRLEMMQSHPGMHESFLGNKETKFGEKDYKTVLGQWMDPSSKASNDLRSMASKVRADVGYFEDTVAMMGNATPQMIQANAASAVKANLAASASFNDELSTTGNVRSMVTDTLKATRLDDMVSGFFESFKEIGISRGSLGGSTALDEAVSGIEILKSRLDALEADGVSVTEAKKVQDVKGTITALETMMTGLLEKGAIDSGSARSTIENTRGRADFINNTAELDSDLGQAKFLNQIADKIEAALAKQTAAMEESNRLAAIRTDAAQETAGNTRRPDTPVDYDATYNASIEQQETE